MRLFKFLVQAVLLLLPPAAVLASRKPAKIEGPEALFCDIEGSCYSDLLPKLPVGCEDYEIVKWPASGSTNTVLMGENHDECVEARFKCSRALSRKGIGVFASQEKPVLLFEPRPFGEQLPCDVVEGGDFSKITDDCRGWNIPEHKRRDVSRLQWKVEKTSKILENVLAFNGEPLPDLLQYIKTTDAKLVSYNKEIDDLLRSTTIEKRNELEALGYLDDFLEHKMHLQLIRVFSKELDGNKERYGLACKKLKNIYENASEELSDFYSDIERFIKEPNESLLKSIQDARKKGAPVIAFAGRLHVQEEPRGELSSYSPEWYDGQKEAVEELYDGLGKGTFAVLSCGGY